VWKDESFEESHAFVFHKHEAEMALHGFEAFSSDWREAAVFL
jgi:hypothetical protein